MLARATAVGLVHATRAAQLHAEAVHCKECALQRTAALIADKTRSYCSGHKKRASVPAMKTGQRTWLFSRFTT